MANIKQISEETDAMGIPLTEMAIDRDQFMTKIQEKFVGAVREYAFVLLAKANQQTQWVQHKETEIERLQLEIVDVFDYERKSGWNPNKAASQAIEFYRDKLRTYATKAMNQYERYYKIKPVKQISSDDLVPFLDHMISLTQGGPDEK